MISKRYVILMKKEKGFENINESIIRKLGIEGWKINRDYQRDFMLATSNKARHIYRQPSDLVKKLKENLSALEITRIKLIELSGGAIENAVNDPKLFVDKAD